ncbi:hypothetical protein FRC0410_00499 [Corynebacterium diphtheriae]|nr:hypothetical protein FRC0410_00499 [Corynebacterium diphtheriae]
MWIVYLCYFHGVVPVAHMPCGLFLGFLGNNAWRVGDADGNPNVFTGQY